MQVDLTHCSLASRVPCLQGLLQVSKSEESFATLVTGPDVKHARDQQILDKASQDIAIINEAQSSHTDSSYEPLEAELELLRTAYNLLQAYQDFLQMIKEEYNVQRPWAREPQSKVCGYNNVCDLGSRCKLDILHLGRPAVTCFTTVCRCRST